MWSKEPFSSYVPCKFYLDAPDLFGNVSLTISFDLFSVHGAGQHGHPVLVQDIQSAFTPEETSHDWRK
jgi:hypothetical protein